MMEIKQAFYARYWFEKIHPNAKKTVVSLLKLKVQELNARENIIHV